MGKLKGQAEAEKFRGGKELTAKQAIKAQCFICNGEEDGSNTDCQGESCPLYPFFLKWVFTRPAGGEGHLPASSRQRNGTREGVG